MRKEHPMRYLLLWPRGAADIFRIYFDVSRLGRKHIRVWDV